MNEKCAELKAYQEIRTVPKVYQAICAVQGEMAKEGISKDHTNTQGGTYKFRGIDDVYNALAPLLAKHKLCILPKVLSRTVTERTSKAGGNLFYINLDVEFDFVSAEDGSKHTLRGAGEAMDSGDKGTNKAMSAAYKYVCFQAFCIPTEGDNDADASTPEVLPKQESKPKHDPHMAAPLAPPADGKKAIGKITSYKPGTIFHEYEVDGVKLSAKKPALIEAMNAANTNGEKVCVVYMQTQNGKYTNNYIAEVIPVISDEVPF